MSASRSSRARERQKVGSTLGWMERNRDDPRPCRPGRRAEIRFSTTHESSEVLTRAEQDTSSSDVSHGHGSTAGSGGPHQQLRRGEMGVSRAVLLPDRGRFAPGS